MSDTNLEYVVGALESTLADLVDAVGNDRVAKAVESLSKVIANMKPHTMAMPAPVVNAPVTVNVEPTPYQINVGGDAKPGWDTLRVTPNRDSRTDAVLSYTIQRIK